MNKLFFIVLLIPLLISCSDNNEESDTNDIDTQINAICTVLNGTFVSSEYSFTLNTTEIHEIVFTPYSSPKKEEWGNNGISKDVTMYGECKVSKYYDDHLLETNKEWKYNIDISYNGAQPKIVYYPSVYGLTESHNITIINAKSFIMDDITYNKQ